MNVLTNAPASFAALATRTGPAVDPLSAGLSALARASDRLTALLMLGNGAGLAPAVNEARTALTEVNRRRPELLEEAAPADDDEIGDQLERLVHAFPEGSPEDLAGYGAQLADDMAALRPSRRALRIGCEQVRLHRRYTRLPAIATVWEAVRDAEAELRAVTARLDALPSRLARAEAALERPMRSTAEQAA